MLSFRLPNLLPGSSGLVPLLYSPPCRKAWEVHGPELLSSFPKYSRPWLVGDGSWGTVDRFWAHEGSTEVRCWSLLVLKCWARRYENGRMMPNFGGVCICEVGHGSLTQLQGWTRQEWWWSHWNCSTLSLQLLQKFHRTCGVLLKSSPPWVVMQSIAGQIFFRVSVRPGDWMCGFHLLRGTWPSSLGLGCRQFGQIIRSSHFSHSKAPWLESHENLQGPGCQYV